MKELTSEGPFTIQKAAEFVIAGNKPHFADDLVKTIPKKIRERPIREKTRQLLTWQIATISVRKQGALTRLLDYNRSIVDATLESPWGSLPEKQERLRCEILFLRKLKEFIAGPQ